jgi:acetyl-CoA carboxylase biotin carboxyl carrier protein
LKPDPEIIRALAELLTETGLSEIEYAVGDHRIRVARERSNGTNGYAADMPAPGALAPMNAAMSAPGKPAAAMPVTAPAVETVPVIDSVHPGAVKSPIVGVAYLSPQPNAPRFVRVGDSVSEGQTLLIIEAMKVMNQIRAPRTGKVTHILIEDAEPVEYNAPLMVIE